MAKAHGKGGLFPHDAGKQNERRGEGPDIPFKNMFSVT
jgi:hypothetical protein